MAEPLLRISNLRVRYQTKHGSVHAVNDFALDVNAGEIVCVIGETGSGKSSVIRSLLGLLPRNAQIEADEVTLSCADASPVQLLRCDQRMQRRMRGAVIGFVPQSTRGALNPVMTIAQQFRASLAAHKVRGSRAEWSEKTHAALHRVGLTDAARVASSYPHQLSGGMAQRVVLALASLLDPPLLIADEPTSGLDATVRRGVLKQLQKACTEEGRTILMVTHDLGIVGRFCQRVVVMYAGCVLESGPVTEVFGDPRHPYTRCLLGAVPRRGRPLVTLPGAVGSLLKPPAACPFHARCPVHLDDRCASEVPPLRTVGPQHQAATFCA